MDDQFYRKVRPRFGVLQGIKKTLVKKNILFSLLVAVPVFFFITFSNKGIIQRFSLESQKHQVQEKIREAQQEQIQLQQQSKALDGDPKAIEKVAREKYGMIREGETVYRVKKEQ
ncbi:MAG: septum formation initiator family protein [Ignavibacteria bacterium]|nr:septum formation initiator family protein [Ignavibacteria bacterium]MBI3765981.1 septum formation initiator family protein [Ignavibacteriales bacterium]